MPCVQVICLYVWLLPNGGLLLWIINNAFTKYDRYRPGGITDISYEYYKWLKMLNQTFTLITINIYIPPT